MEEFILEHEQTLRLSVFVGLLATMGLWELASPRRAPAFSKGRRWITNLAFSLLNSLMLRFFVPVLAVGTAVWAQDNTIGLFNIIHLSHPLEWLIAILLLDLLIYGQHVLFHFVPVFWRLHKVHHADPDIDSSTAIRVHPVEILLSMFIKLGAVLLLGVAPLAVIVFEIVLNATALFNHGNVRIPSSVDAVLRRFLVTPDMHRVHHSVIVKETNSNFGFNLSVWDRLFGTYRADPEKGHLDMEIGLAEFRNDAPTKLVWSLILPFRNAARKDPS